MKKLLDMSMDAGQEHAIQAFDQQLYAIAQQVKWSRPDILEPHVLRLGGFHSLSTFIFALVCSISWFATLARYLRSSV